MRGFAEAARNQRVERPFASCVPGRSYQLMPEYYITHNLGNRGAYWYDCLSFPASPKWGLPRLVTSATESGQSPLIGPDAAHPITLHPLDVLVREESVGNESAIVEDGVVAARHGVIVA